MNGRLEMEGDVTMKAVESNTPPKIEHVTLDDLQENENW
jgi:hypothetical protein